MIPLRPLSALPLLAVAALAVAAASPAHATSMSTHTVVMTLTLDAATYDFNGSDVNLGGDNSSQDENVFDGIMGSASTNGSSAFTVNGMTPTDPSQFEFGVGDTIVVTCWRRPRPTASARRPSTAATSSSTSSSTTSTSSSRTSRSTGAGATPRTRPSRTWPQGTRPPPSSTPAFW